MKLQKSTLGNGQVCIRSDRGLVCRMEAGSDKVRNDDAEKIVERFNSFEDRPQNNSQLTQLEMTGSDLDFAQKMAKRMHFTQTSYNSTSQLIGLFCLPNSRDHKHGCIIKTRELGFLFVADCDDLCFHDLANEERSAR